MKTIVLPQRLDTEGLIYVASVWRSAEEPVQLDFSRQEWVEPIGTVGLSCLVTKALSMNQGVEFANVGHCSNSSYWARMKFFENFGHSDLAKVGSNREANGRFSEIRLVELINNNDKIADEIVSVTKPDQESYVIYQHIVSEALNNICQHSKALGFTASQYYQYNNNVVFSIGDYGQGLLNSLKRFGLCNDQDAILKALEVGVSGRSQAEQRAEPDHMRNRGVGLSMIQRLVVLNGGSLTVWSGDKLYREDSNGYTFCEAPPWSGVLVMAEIPRNQVNTPLRTIRQDVLSLLSSKETKRIRWTRMP